MPFTLSTPEASSCQYIERFLGGNVVNQCYISSLADQTTKEQDIKKSQKNGHYSEYANPNPYHQERLSWKQ
jgi:hypothetical protein